VGLDSDISVRLFAWIAAAVFAANPSLMYLQTTAMTEPLYLAFFVWAVVHLQRFVFALRKASSDERPNKRKKVDSYVPESASLTRCGWCLAAAAFPRYDGWFAIVMFAVVVCAIIFKLGPSSDSSQRTALVRAVRNFVFITAASPAFW